MEPAVAGAAPANRVDPSDAGLYHADFAAWAETQARHLRARLPADLPRCWRLGRRFANGGPQRDDLGPDGLPTTCAYGLDDPLDETRVPVSRHGLP